MEQASRRAVKTARATYEGRIMNKFTSLIRSRRAQATVSGILIVLFRDTLGLDAGTATTIVALLMSWVVGDSLKNTE